MTQFGERESKKKFVPWFNSAEWDQVYKQIYSDDTAAQIKGFEHLLLWKARCPQGIPVGVQCTLDLIRICLKDREVWPQIASGMHPPYQEYDLQLTYSMAILRFLNHLATLTQNKTESLYRLAAKLHIPDWVVNIRHETSHGNNLPSLSILREAAHFCLDWIHEHYWKNEAEMTMDWIVTDESSDYIAITHHLKDIIEMWQAVMLYFSGGFTTFTEIPDEDLKKHLLDEKMKYSTQEMNVMVNKLKHQGCILDSVEMTEAQLLILKELEGCMLKCSKFGDKYKILVDVLLDGDGFLASPDFISVFHTDRDIQRLATGHLPINFLNLWRAMLLFLHQNKVIPLLVDKLLYMSSSEHESCHRRKMAALWMKELTMSLSKVKKTVELIECWEKGDDNTVKIPSTFKIKSRGKVQMKTTASHIHKKITKKVEKKNLDLKNVMTLKVMGLPSSVTNMKLLRKAIQKPNEWTQLYLASLMDLAEPPLPNDTKEKLTALIDIYTQQVHCSNNEYVQMESPVQTIDNLMKTSAVSQNDYLEVLDVTESESLHVSSPREKSHWTHDKDFVDWGKCPLGVLPWQQEKFMLQLDLPCDTVWKSTIQDNHHIITEKNLPGFFQEKINWDEVLSKRPRRSRCVNQQSQFSNVVEKAFDVILNAD